MNGIADYVIVRVRSSVGPDCCYGGGCSLHIYFCTIGMYAFGFVLEYMSLYSPHVDGSSSYIKEVILCYDFIQQTLNLLLGQDPERQWNEIYDSPLESIGHSRQRLIFLMVLNLRL